MPPIHQELILTADGEDAETSTISPVTVCNERMAPVPIRSISEILKRSSVHGSWTVAGSNSAGYA